MVFLRINREFWNDKTIAEAHAKAREENLSSRVSSMIAEDDAFEG